MTNQDRYQVEINARRYVNAARLALTFAGNCASRSRCWAWADEAVNALTVGGLDDLAGRVRAALNDGTSWPNLDAAEGILDQ
jgi:hypothetical protein